MPVSNGIRSMAAVAAALFMSAGPALADRIDGDWCNSGRSLTINGASIVTPGGNKISGDYGRHDFRYTVPAGETGSGAAVAMKLINDDNVEVRFGSEAPQLWRRCRVTS